MPVPGLSGPWPRYECAASPIPNAVARSDLSARRRQGSFISMPPVCQATWLQASKALMLARPLQSVKIAGRDNQTICSLPNLALRLIIFGTLRGRAERPDYGASKTPRMVEPPLWVALACDAGQNDCGRSQTIKMSMVVIVNMSPMSSPRWRKSARLDAGARDRQTGRQREARRPSRWCRRRQYPRNRGAGDLGGESF